MPDELDDLLGSLPSSSPTPRLRRPARPAARVAAPTLTAPALPISPKPTALAAPSWSLNRAGEVKDWYKTTYGRDLPVSAMGQTATHTKRFGLDHSQAMDVALSPASAEGQALVSYLQQNGIPHRAITSADVARGVKATNEHIHIGNPSHGLGAAQGGDELDRLMADVPAVDELDNLLADVPSVGHYTLTDAGWSKTNKPPTFALPQTPSVEDLKDETIRVNAQQPGTATPLPMTASLPRLSARPDPYTQQGRAERDARTQLEQRPDAREILDLPLPQGVKDWSDLDERQLAVYAGQRGGMAEGVPADFAYQWLMAHPDRFVNDPATGQPLNGAGAVGSSAYDERRRTIRISANMPFLLEMKRAYEAERNQLDRAVDWFDDDTRSAGEKALDVAAPVGAAAVKGFDLATRPFSALNANVWSRANRPGLLNKAAALGNPLDIPALVDAGRAFAGYDTPNAQNPIAAWARDMPAGSVGAEHPDLTAATAGVVEMLTDPANLIPVGELATGAKFLRGLPGVRKVEQALSVGNDLRFARAGKVLDIENVVRDMHPADVLDVHGFEVTRGLRPPGQAGSAPWQVRAPNARRPLVFNSDSELQDFADSVVANAARPASPVPAGRAPRLRKAATTALDVAAAPKSILSSADISAPGRQGLIFTVTHPALAGKAMVRQVKSLVSQSAHDDLLRWLTTHPDAELAEASGLYSAMKSAAGRLSGREDAFMSRLAGRLPVVKQSERAYVAYLDSLRQDVFSKYARQLEAAGLTFADNPDEFKSIARFVNAATGRGELPKMLERAAPVLNATLFAPHNLAGRAAVLNPVFYARMSPAARKIAAKEIIKAVAAVTGGMYLAHLGGAKVTLNPADPDFGKVVVGKTHYDFTGGHRSPLRFVAQLGQTFAGARRGDLNSVGRQALSQLVRFLRQQSAPVVNYAWAAKTGKEIDGSDFEPLGHIYRGDKFAPGGGVVDRTLFLVLQDLFDAWAEEGGRGVGKALPALGGVGVQTYEPKRRN